MTNSLIYTGGNLNRFGNKRKDTIWISKQFKKNSGKVIPIWRNLNLIQNYNNLSSHSQKKYYPHALLLDQRDVTGQLQKANEIVLLGLLKNRPIFAVDFSNQEEHLLSNIIGHGKFVNLRQIGSYLSASDSALMAYARGITHWHRQNQFCSRCGSKTQSKDSGHMRLCSNKLCLHSTFPRTDPAVIMLVERVSIKNKDRYCLLGRQRAWPKGMYSTLAGFVEPGESLEEAVAREVFEESGIIIGNVGYKCSQPWPFPSSIMLGFWAQAKTEIIKIDKQELEDVKWFSESEVRHFGEWGDKKTHYQMPRKDSIARHLIETWLIGAHPPLAPTSK